jgi:anti-sigma-K factor RskA
MNLSRPDRRDRLDALAAQYALGTLSARARRRLGAVARRDATVADALREWELRLASMGTAVPPVTPSPRVWSAIVSHLGLVAHPDREAPWWSRLRLWRGLAIASTTAALALGVALVATRVGPPPPSIVVVLSGPDARPTLIATSTANAQTLTFRAIGPVQVAPDRSLELWALPTGGAPRSLGLIPPSGSGRVDVPAAALDTVPAIAISLEPLGGSPTGAPTGPVLWSGKIERI